MSIFLVFLGLFITGMVILICVNPVRQEVIS